MRLSELIGLKPQDIHSERMLIRVREGKGRKDRYTLLSARLIEEFRAGITHGHGIHSLRHSFATHLLESGVDLPTIQRLMGYTNLSRTARYPHVTSRHLRAISSPLKLLRFPRAEETIAPDTPDHTPST